MYREDFPYALSYIILETFNTIRRLSDFKAKYLSYFCCQVIKLAILYLIMVSIEDDRKCSFL